MEFSNVRQGNFLMGCTVVSLMVGIGLSIFEMSVRGGNPWGIAAVFLVIGFVSWYWAHYKTIRLSFRDSDFTVEYPYRKISQIVGYSEISRAEYHDLSMGVTIYRSSGDSISVGSSVEKIFGDFKNEKLSGADPEQSAGDRFLLSKFINSKVKECSVR